MLPSGEVINKIYQERTGKKYSTEKLPSGQKMSDWQKASNRAKFRLLRFKAFQKQANEKRRIYRQNF